MNDKGKICNSELYKEVAQELGVSEKLVRDIANAQSELTVETIKRGGFESVRYVYLGKIGARHRMVQMINDIVGKQNK